MKIQLTAKKGKEEIIKRLLSVDAPTFADALKDFGNKVASHPEMILLHHSGRRFSALMEGEEVSFTLEPVHEFSVCLN